MNLHIGSGSVYLLFYINIDVPAPDTYLAADRPDLVERWQTTEDKYYAMHHDKTIESLAAGPLQQEYVCDRFGDFSFLPVKDGYATEILTRQAFEHLSIAEARVALSNMYRALAPGGILRIDVPHHTETLSLLMETRNPFYVRHLIGPRRGEYGFHMMSYDRSTLKKLVQEAGFWYVSEEPNIHFFPAFCLRFLKP